MFLSFLSCSFSSELRFIASRIVAYMVTMSLEFSAFIASLNVGPFPIGVFISFFSASFALLSSQLTPYVIALFIVDCISPPIMPAFAGCDS